MHTLSTPRIKEISTFLLLNILMVTSLASQSTWHVNASATGSNNGINWANAFTDLQDALTAAQDGDQIWVAAGVYKPTDVPSERDASFSISGGISLYGGFPSTGNPVFSDRDWEVHVTVLSGDIDNNDPVDANGITPDGDSIAGANSYTIIQIEGILEDVILDGFFITGGHANTTTSAVNLQSTGGALFALNNDSQVSISNVEIIGNMSYNGGAILFSNGSLDLDNVQFFNNVSTNSGGSNGGSGIRMVVGSEVSIQNSSFQNNRSSRWGGAILSLQSKLTIIGCNFLDNFGNQLGGAIYAQGDTLSIMGSDFSENKNNLTANSEGGGAIYVFQTVTEITNSEFHDNGSRGAGGALRVDGANASLELSNSEFNSNYVPGGAAGGGGLFISSNVPVVQITGTSFVENSTTGSFGGGAIFKQGSNEWLIEDCIFESNFAGGFGNGGSIYNQSPLTILNSTFTADSTTGSGGSLDQTSQARLTIIGSSFSNCSASSSGGAIIHRAAGDTIFIQNTVFSGNSASSGGALYFQGTGTQVRQITDSEFTGNSANRAGAIFHTGGSGLLQNISINNLYSGNTAIGTSGSGGAIEYFISPQSSIYDECHFIGNSAVSGTSDGGAIHGSGLIVTNSTFTENVSGRNGGALSIATSEVLNSSFFNNTAGSDGGGIYHRNIANNFLTVDESTFSGNQAGSDGGGLYILSSDGLVTSSTFTENNAGVGGGIRIAGDVTLINCKISGNSATATGGGISNWSAGTVMISGCEITGNSAGTNGGGYSDDWGVGNTDVSFINTTLASNTAGGDGGAIFNRSDIAKMTNSIVWGNNSGIFNFGANASVATDHSIIEGGITPCDNCPGGDGDIDPLFVEQISHSFAPVDSGNYELRFCSPAINAGDPDTSGLNLPELDLLGNDRIKGDTIDLGAYEFQGDSILFVSSNDSISGNGANWAGAYLSLQDAIEDACSCEDVREIWVAAGTYYPDEGRNVSPGDRDATFQLCNGVELYGGFNGTETELNQRDWEANETTLSGDINQSNTLDGNSYTVVTGSGTDSTAVIDGFIITAGNADFFSGSLPNPQRSGGGMYIDAGSPTVTNCTFIGNSSTEGGGMINLENSSPTVTNSTFSGNTATIGGGMFNWVNSSTLVVNSTFSGNTAGFWGGGMFNFEGSSSTVMNSTFSGNTAGFWGGGMVNNEGSSTVTNCTFSGNTASEGGGMYNWFNSSPMITNCAFVGNTANEGGGMYNWDGSSPTVTNCTFTGNTATVNGGGIFNRDNCFPIVTNTIIWNNSADGDTTSTSASVFNVINSSPEFSYSLIANSGGSVNWNADIGMDGGNNIDVNPQFSDPSSGNFQQTVCSPGLDAGTPDTTGLGLPAMDLEGNPRFFDALGDGVARVDIGAFEFQAQGTLLEVECTAAIEVYLDGQGNGVLDISELDAAVTISVVSSCAGGVGLTGGSFNFDCEDTGQMLSVSITATDSVSLRQDSCLLTVEVLDTIPPMIVFCPASIDTTITEEGVTEADLMIASAEFTDACGIESIENNINSNGADASDIYGPGTTEVVITATDSSGNSGQCIFTVSVTVPFTISCPQDAVLTTDMGVCSAMVSLDEATAFSPFQPVTITNDYNNGGPDAIDSYPQGITVVTFTATDDNGDMVSCTTTVTVNDSEPPSIDCPQDVTVVIPEGTGPADVTLSLATASDNCTSDPEISNDHNAGGANASGMYPVGTTVVTFEAEDESGNINSCTTTVTVEEADALTINCPSNATVETDPGECTAVVTLALATAFSGFPPVNIENDFNDGGADASDSYPQGITVVTFTATDDNGDMVSCTTTVTVNDTEPPSISCPADVTVIIPEGTGPADVTLSLASASDNCTSDPEISNDHNSGGANASGMYPVGTTVVTFEAEDESGNTNSCTTAVTVEEADALTINCPSNATVETDPGECTAEVSLTPATAFSGFPPVNIENDFNDGGADASDIYPQGITVVTFTATDDNGDMVSCTTTVTVNDTEPPSISCPADVAVVIPEGTGPADVTLSLATASDNCTTDPEISNDHNAGGANASGMYPVGTTVVTFEAEDDFGNTNSCTTQVTVEEADALTINCPSNATVNTDPDECTAEVTLALATAFSGFPPVTITNDFNNGGPDASDSYSQGITVVTFTATDDNGDMLSCTTTVTVNDTEPPSIACPQDVTVVIPEGTGPADVTLSLATASDNCTSDPEISNDQNSGGADASGMYAVGTTVVTFEAEDETGNTNFCTTAVTVEEADALTINCPSNATVNTDPGECTAEVTLALATAFSGFPPVTIENDFNDGGPDASGIYDEGVTTIVFTASDGNGDMVSCTTVVTVNDMEAPTLNCPSMVSANTAASSCDAFVSLVVTASDNCGIEEASNSFNSGGLNASGTFGLGDTEVIFTVSDAGGLSSSCTVVVSVTDNVAPQITCPADVSVMVDPGENSIFIGNLVATATDNCTPDPEISNNQNSEGDDASGDYPVGVTMVIFTAEDEAVNVSNCTTVVEVIDVLPLMLSCPDDVEISVDEGQCGRNLTLIAELEGGIEPVVVTNTKTSNGLDASAFYEVGTEVVAFTATADDGETAICSVTVTIVDDEAPELVCNNLTIELATAPVSIEVEDIVPSAEDNCGIESIELSQSEFGCDDLGTHIVQVTATDAAGNEANCTAIVTVEDNTPPTAVCSEIDMVFTTVLETATPDINDLDGGSSDACGVVNLSADIPDLSCADAGTVEIELIVEDANGNTSVCTAVVNVVCAALQFEISGQIYHEDGSMVGGVKVDLLGFENASFETESDGEYEFTVFGGTNAIIIPLKDTLPVENVTTLDIIMIQRHILGKELLDSPYKIIASDASGDGITSTFDLVLFQTLIVGLIEELPVPSWVFVKSSYEFEDPTNPLAESFPTVRAFQAVMTDYEDQDFIGVKLGYVKYSINGGSRVEHGNPVGMQLVQDGPDVLIKTTEAIDLSGLSLSLERGAGDRVSQGLLSEQGLSNWHMDEAGVLRYIWTTGGILKAGKGEVLFRMENVQVSDIMLSENDRLPSEVVTGDKVVRPIVLSHKVALKDELIISVFPNPVFDFLNLKITDLADDKSKLWIYNAQAELLYQSEVIGASGAEKLVIDCSHWPPGVYLIRVKSGELSAEYKFIKVN